LYPMILIYNDENSLNECRAQSAERERVKT
jgi:hypothetical protein